MSTGSTKKIGKDCCMDQVLSPLSLNEKIKRMIQKFSSFLNPNERYEYLMELGRTLLPIPQTHLTEENKVEGCQSILYLYATQETPTGPLCFFAQSDALISAGLAALLIEIYSGETAEKILTTPPQFLHDIGIFTSLSPNRSNGLMQIHLRMKKEALKSVAQIYSSSKK